jgi:hypothetical protein
MTNVLAERCALHSWERELETRRGVECVVRVCRCCGRKELCWSRVPLRPSPRELSEEPARACRKE